ncbi:MAG: hypothetical protein WCO71_05580, partial [Pseudomonadota bacterium]
MSNWGSIGNGFSVSGFFVGGSYSVVTDQRSGVQRESYTASVGPAKEIGYSFDRTYSAGLPSSGLSPTSFNFGFSLGIGLNISINLNDPQNVDDNSATLSFGTVGVNLSFSKTYTTKIIGVDSDIAKQLDTPSESNALNREIGRILGKETTVNPAGTLDPQQRADLARQDASQKAAAQTEGGSGNYMGKIGGSSSANNADLGTPSNPGWGNYGTYGASRGYVTGGNSDKVTNPTGLRDPQQQQEFDRQVSLAPPSIPPQNLAPSVTAPALPSINVTQPSDYDPGPIGGSIPNFTGDPIENRRDYDPGPIDTGSSHDGGSIPSFTGDPNEDRRDYDPGPSDSWGGWGPGGDTGSESDYPLLLDLDNNGVSITALSSSDIYFDMAGDGQQHRTAWAGKGDGVLAIDANLDGKIDQQNEIVFSAWDPTARTDFEALRNIFDTNHNGKLDAGDARFAQFRVVVAGPDNNNQVKTLSQLGIVSIDLTSNRTAFQFSDGSSIDGVASFTRTDGSKGIAADATLASDAEGGSIAIASEVGTTSREAIASNKNPT